MENIVFNSKKFLGRKQIVLDCKFNIDASNCVEKVLAIEAKPIILHQRCEDGKVIFGGKLDTSFIYLSQNGQKICLVSVSEFSQVYENSEISSSDEALLECKVVDITTPSVKTNEVKVACIVDVSVSLVTKKEVQVCEQENVITKSAAIEKMQVQGVVSGNFDILEEIKIQDSVSKVLKVDAHTCLLGVTCGNGFLTLDLKVFLNTIYVDDFDAIKVNKQIVPLRQEVECTYCTQEGKASINVVPLNYLGKAVVTQGEGFNLVKVQIPVQYSGIVLQKDVQDVVCDAYSVTQITKLEEAEEEYISDCENVFFEAKAVWKLH